MGYLRKHWESIFIKKRLFQSSMKFSKKRAFEKCINRVLQIRTGRCEQLISVGPLYLDWRSITPKMADFVPPPPSNQGWGPNFGREGQIPAPKTPHLKHLANLWKIEHLNVQQKAVFTIFEGHFVPWQLDFVLIFWKRIFFDLFMKDFAYLAKYWGLKMQ